jgi:RND family efflux transporter MFP subunit
MKPRKIIFISLLIVVITITAVVTSCGGRAGAAQVAASQQITVARADLVSKATGSGRISIPNDAKLAFGSGGKLTRLTVKEGDRVAKGALLAQLDTASLEVAMAQARVGIDQAKVTQSQAASALNAAQFALDKTKGYADMRDDITNLQWEIKIAQMNMMQSQDANDAGGAGYWRQIVTVDQLNLAKKTKDLADLLSKAEYTGVVTYDIMGDKYDRLTVNDMKTKQLALETAQRTLDLTASGLTQAQKNVDLIQKQINDSTIYAPFDGIAATVYSKEGDILPSPTVSPQVVIYFVDTSAMQVSVSLDELDITGVQKNQKAYISVDALPGSRFEGSVTSVSVGPVSMNGTGGGAVYEAKVDFNLVPGMQVKPGMAASVDIITGEKKNVMVLPAKVIQRDGQGKSCVMTQSNQLTPVTLGISDGKQVEIVSGLKDGDLVFTDKTDSKWTLPANK